MNRLALSVPLNWREEDEWDELAECRREDEYDRYLESLHEDEGE